MSKNLFTPKEWAELTERRDIVSVKGRFFVAVEVLKSAELKSADEVAALPAPEPEAPAEAPTEFLTGPLTTSSRKK